MANLSKSLLFESKTCSRCGGSGTYSYCQRYGTTCFGCGGRGVTLTKRGAAAQAFLNASRLVAITDLVAGDVVYTTGITLGGGVYDQKVTVVDVGEEHQYGSSLKDGAWVPTLGRTLYALTTKGEAYNYTTSSTHTFRKVFAPLEDAAKKAAALAYQATLTATGTVAKRTKKSA